MCGICGVFQIRGEPGAVIDEGTLDRMTDSMVHRGPNDRGTYRADGAALGVRRLSIVDVEGGHQPVANEAGTIWAIQNGELYNHGEIRRALGKQGHRFRSRCDTEVIPHVYEAGGVTFAKQLRGKFAVALWDEARRRGVVARDRLGVKPLYWSEVGNLLVFGSELKAVLASGLVDDELDFEAIDAYLTLGFVPGPRTPLARVSKLPPGQLLVVEDGKVTVQPYWTHPNADAPDRGLSQDEHAERLLAALEESVRLRLMSDVPLGAMLSGGLDSSLVVALMARNMTEPVKTFSVGFAEDAEFNELADARLVARRFGTDHHELELSVAEREVDLADLVWHLDEPLADLSSLGFLALSELAAKHVTVALSGQGADELLGGYERYRTTSVAARWQRLPSIVRAAPERLGARIPRLERRVRLLATSGSEQRWLLAHANLDEALRTELARGDLTRVDGGGARAALAPHLGAANGNALDAMLYLDAKLPLVDDMLHYFDRASMARSLEVRVPFLDHHVVETCARIPADLKVRGLTTKYVLKHAARGLVPDEIVDKRKIGFFNRAVERWLEAQTDGVVTDYLLDEQPRYAQFLDRRRVARLVQSNGGGTHRRLLLSILMLEIWLKSYLPRALEGSSASASRLSVAS
jgi:asparagine synthase (glutamine-hydrolysing)